MYAASCTLNHISLCDSSVVSVNRFSMDSLVSTGMQVRGGMCLWLACPKQNYARLVANTLWLRFHVVSAILTYSHYLSCRCVRGQCVVVFTKLQLQYSVSVLRVFTKLQYDECGRVAGLWLCR